MRRKNILMIVESSYPGDPRVRREASTLKDRFDITVIALKRRGEKSREIVDGVRVLRIPRLPVVPVGKFHYLLEYLYLTIAASGLFLLTFPSRRYRVIHAHNPPDTLFLVGLLGKLCGARFVFDHHDLSPELYLSRFGGKKDLTYRILLWLERCSCRLADIVVTTNESYRALVAERHQVPLAKIHVVRNDPVLADLSAGAAPRSELPVLAARSILYLGAINPQDGLDHLMEIVRILAFKRGRRDFKCYVLGDGDSLPMVRKMVDNLGISDLVEIKGFIFDREVVRHYLAGCTLGVEPAPDNPLNRRSTFIKIMEFMAAGKPFVAFDLPETRVSSGEAGLLVPSGDLAGFAHAVSSLLDDPVKAGNLGAAGSERIRLCFNWDLAASRLRNAYQQLISMR